MQSRLQFRRPETLVRVGIRPLPLGGLHALIAARLGHARPRPSIARIHDIAGGNPFFALELAARANRGESGGIVDLPDTLAALVRRRIGDTDDDVAAVLLAAASAAAPTVELIGRSTGWATDRVVELLDGHNCGSAGVGFTGAFSREYRHAKACDGHHTSNRRYPVPSVLTCLVATPSF